MELDNLQLESRDEEPFKFGPNVVGRSVNRINNRGQCWFCLCSHNLTDQVLILLNPLSLCRINGGGVINIAYKIMSMVNSQKVGLPQQVNFSVKLDK